MRLTDSIWAIRCVWLRYFDVFRRSILYYTVTTFTETDSLFAVVWVRGRNCHWENQNPSWNDHRLPKLYFFRNYWTNPPFSGVFRGRIRWFRRMYYQKIFQAMAITPITLSEVLWGELIWDAGKATMAALVVTLIGVRII